MFEPIVESPPYASPKVVLRSRSPSQASVTSGYTPGPPTPICFDDEQNSVLTKIGTKLLPTKNILRMTNESVNICRFLRSVGSDSLVGASASDEVARSSCGADFNAARAIAVEPEDAFIVSVASHLADG